MGEHNSTLRTHQRYIKDIYMLKEFVWKSSCANNHTFEAPLAKMEGEEKHVIQLMVSVKSCKPSHSQVSFMFSVFIHGHFPSLQICWLMKLLSTLWIQFYPVILVLFPVHIRIHTRIYMLHLCVFHREKCFLLIMLY